MNEEKDFGFKDKEISEISAALAKANKRQFGESFKNAAAEVGAPVAGTAAAATVEPALTSTSAGQSSVVITPGPKPEDETLEESSAPVSQVTTAQNEADKTADNEAQKKEFYSVVKPLQTYERDIAETIRSNSESVASINLKQQKKREDMEKKGEIIHTTEKVAQKSITVLISIVMIIAGTGIISLIYYFLSTRPPEVVPASASIITTNETRTFNITGLDSTMVAGEIRRAMEKSGTQGDLVKIEITEGVAENKKIISSERFFELFAIDSEPALGRAFGEQWVFGFHSTGGIGGDNSITVDSTNLAPFLFLSIESFDNAFSGMIKWENKMAENLRGILINSDIIIPTTNPIGPASPNRFEDKIIRSKDTRVLKDNLGNTILLYSFLDPKNLVITINEETFSEILDRFFSSQLVR